MSNINPVEATNTAELHPQGFSRMKPTADPASQGVIVAVRSALLTHSEHASKMSADIMGKLITQDEVAINE